jgi:hypothetical protein
MLIKLESLFKPINIGRILFQLILHMHQAVAFKKKITRKLRFGAIPGLFFTTRIVVILVLIYYIKVIGCYVWFFIVQILRKKIAKNATNFPEKY